MYSKASTRKHKRWENDGFLHYNYQTKELRLLKPRGREPNFRGEVFKIIGSRLEREVEDEFVPGHQFQKSGYELEIQEEIGGERFIEDDQENEFEQENVVVGYFYSKFRYK